MATLKVPVSATDHAQGDEHAPITLVEYGDYECPDCGRAYPMLKELTARFGDDLRFVFRHFPQYTVHRHASMAAQAAEAAGAQGKFWPMHDLMYQHQRQLETEDLTHHALQLGLEVYRFEQALDSGTYRRRIEEDYAGGERSGVKGTPTLFINEKRFEGKVEIEALTEAISRAKET